MRKFLHDHRGQLNVGLVWGIVIMLVAISIGGLIYSKISGVAVEQTEENSIAENIMTDVNKGATTIFPLLVLIVIISAFVALIAVLRVLG